jgi:hypothetical protein
MFFFAERVIWGRGIEGIGLKKTLRANAVIGMV